MVLAVSAAPSASVTAADGSTLPGVLISATGITPGLSNRIVRWWRQQLDGTWLEIPAVDDGTLTSTTQAAVDWTCPDGVLDPDTPATPYSYGISVRTQSTGIFTFASGVLSSPGHLARPGGTPWLVHPTSPELSLPVVLESDTGRTRPLDLDPLQPYGARSPVVIGSGVRPLREGRIVFNVPRTYREQLAALIGDGAALYLAQGCGQASTDDGYLFLRDPTDDVIASASLRVESAYQQVYPGRVSPPSNRTGSGGDWWE